MVDALKALCNTTLIALATGYTRTLSLTPSHFLLPYLQRLVSLSLPLYVCAAALSACLLCSRRLTGRYSFLLIKPV